jgi:hypothetical protein
MSHWTGAYTDSKGRVRPISAPQPKTTHPSGTPSYRPRSKARHAAAASNRKISEAANKTNNIRLLKQRFKQLNPEVGVDMIDWEAQIGKKENYSESLKDLKAAYPEYKWMKNKTENYDSAVVSNIRKEAGEYNYSLIKDSERKRLTQTAKLTDRLRPDVKAPSKPRDYEYVHEFDRKWPDGRETPKSD